MTMVELIQPNNYSSPGLTDLTVAATLLQPDGAFRLQGVSPGSYEIGAVQRGPAKPSRYASDPATLPELAMLSKPVAGAFARIEVKNANVRGVDLEMKPPGPGRLKGQIAFQDEAPFPLNQLEVRLHAGGELAGPVNSLYAPVKSDGSFVFPPLFTGPYQAYLFQPPDGAYLVSARWGSQDVLAHPFAFNPGSSSLSLKLVIGVHPATLSGEVHYANGRPCQGAMVVIVPPPALRGAAELYRSVPTDQNGQFTISKIRPGSYTVYAWREIENYGWFDPSVVKAAAGFGVLVDLRKGEEKQLRFHAIPISKTPRP